VPELLNDIAIALVGFLTGILSGLFGIGGAIVSTPAIRLLGVPASLAVASTLPSIIPGAITGGIRYSRVGLVTWSAVRVVAPFGVLFAIIGAVTADRMPGDGHYLMIATALLIIWTAWRMLHPPQLHESSGHSKFKLACVGIGSGLLSGLLGVGGGFVMVPVFVGLLGFQMKRAVATSLVCVAVFAIPGTITHAVLDNIDWRVAGLLTIGVIPGVYVATKYVVAVADKSLRIAMAIILCVVASGFIVGEVIALTSSNGGG
jgi:hypothetical protein